MYAGDDFRELTQGAQELINQLCEGKPDRELNALLDIIVKTSYFEYMFWDMVWEGASWPIPAELLDC